jgi:hypothetical protein
LLRVAGARIVQADGFAFDSPDEGITGHDSACVRWRSVTAGAWDGVVVELDEPERAELCLVTAPMSLRMRPADAGPLGQRFAARDPQRGVEVRWVPEH